MDAEDRADSAEAWLRTCDECEADCCNEPGASGSTAATPLAFARSGTAGRQPAPCRVERVRSTPYEGAPDKVRPVVVAAAPTPSRRQGAATERQPGFEERHMEASREVTE